MSEQDLDRLKRKAEEQESLCADIQRQIDELQKRWRQEQELLVQLWREYERAAGII